MKIPFRDIENFVQNPDKNARVILIYGPDHGLMQERSNIIGKSVVEDLNDPFNVAVLSTDSLIEDPARLSDEANAMSMMGGERLIRIEDSTDKITTFIKEYLSEPSDHSLILLQARELGPRSTLRKLCEGAKNAAALPCYVEDERDLSRFIQNTLQAENLHIEHDAVQWLAANINGDRLKVRGELEKLITYKGSEETPISLQDVIAACGQAGVGSLDTLVYDVANGNTFGALKAYQTLSEEGVVSITILRALQNHFRRLHLTKAKIQEGENITTAIKSLSPPIFFKYERDFSAQVNKWNFSSLSNALKKLNALEAQTKQTGAQSELLCSQAILGLSASAGKR